MRVCLKIVTPERFYRGSTMLTTTLSQVEWVGGAVIVSSGFPIKHPGMTTLRGPPLVWWQSAGKLTHKD
jgi:hypothetical protein